MIIYLQKPKNVIKLQHYETFSCLKSITDKYLNLLGLSYEKAAGKYKINIRQLKGFFIYESTND